MNLCKGEETEGQTHAVCWGRRSDELAGPQWSDGNPTQSEDSGSDCGLMQTRDQTEKDTIKRAEDRQKNKVETQEKEVHKKWFEKTSVREKQGILGTPLTVGQVTQETLTRRAGFSDVCQRAVDRLLGLVTVLPQEDKTDLLTDLRSYKTLLHLLFNDVICERQKNTDTGLKFIFK